MGNIEHLPERLAVLCWDRHADPELVRSTWNMALREYVRGDLYRQVVEALKELRQRDAASDEERQR